MEKNDFHIFSGLQRDLSISKQKPEFLWDAYNIRLTAMEGNTQMSITNEKGPLEIPNCQFIGTYLGHCVLDNYVILFTHSTGGQPDYIYKIIKEDADTFTISTLFNGNANFDDQHPIETLGVYENNNIQKVYWVDGKNQPRVIRTDDTYTSKIEENGETNVDKYNFIRTLQLQETVTVEKIYGDGEFAPGVLQYAFTYYDKYGQESNIFYTTPLYYTSFIDRAGSPEEKVANSFKITVENLDEGFGYLRIYSILRTSLNGTPITKRVADIELKGLRLVEYIDNGLQGEIIDPTILSYVGGEEITASTITQKDNTLFLGDITLTREPINVTKDKLLIGEIQCAKRSVNIPLVNKDDYYLWSNSLSVGNTAGFKHNEYYKLGVQFQHKTGKWSEPIPLEIVQQKSTPDYIPVALEDENNSDSLNYSIANLLIPTFIASLNKGTLSELHGKGYKKVRPVVVFPNPSSRKVLTQGVLAPTVSNSYNTVISKGIPEVQSSWFFRPFLSDKNGNVADFNFLRNDTAVNKGAFIQFKHDHYLLTKSTDYNYNSNTKLGTPTGDARLSNGNKEYNKDVYSNDIVKIIDFSNSNINTAFKDKETGLEKYRIQPQDKISVHVNNRGAEIQCHNIRWKRDGNSGDLPVYNYDDKSNFIVKQDVLTMHSPDIASDDFINTIIDPSKLTLDVHSYAKAYSSIGDIDVQTSSPAKGKYVRGFIKPSISINSKELENNFFNIGRSLVSGLFYEAEVTKEGEADNYDTKALWMIYPWQRSGSLNDDFTRSTGTRKAVLSKKIISNLKVYRTSLFDKEEEGDHQIVDIKDIQLFNNDQVSLLKLNSTDDKSLSYIGNVDTALGVNTSYAITRTYKISDDSTIIKSPFNDSTTWTIKKYTTHLDIDWDSDCVINFPEIKYGENEPHSIDRFSSESVRMKYKSTPHLVTTLEGNIQDLTTPGPLSIKDSAFLFIADVIHGNIDESPIFPVDKECLWLPAGESIRLKEAYNEEDTSNIVYSYGDTWYQRWDCLKTYAFTPEDENQIVEIGSFMLESRINVDGRYDRNRGQFSNLNMSPINFNLINPVYSQLDNFFTYRRLDEDYYKLNSFSNTITWTKTKSNGEETDTWTNVTMTNTYDVDGAKGKVTSLNLFNDNLLCFQEYGISQLLYNERVQIPTSDGTPVEIGNSNKLQGSRYISGELGCTNKWSICNTPSGVYFIDSVSKNLYQVNSNGLSNVSLNHGLSHWFRSQNGATWNPYDHQGTKLFYDNTRNDLYMVFEDGCLLFSEVIGQFISFMNYDFVPAMFNIGESFLVFNKNSTWQMFEGDYNDFFGNYSDCYIQFISNDNSALDKIFTNLEIQSDFYSKNPSNDTNYNPINYKQLNFKEFFDYIRVETDYQDTSKVPLTFKNAKPSNLKKKFRLWRIDVPRDKVHKLDRIRNPWCRITLGMDRHNSDKPKDYSFELHNLSVQYHV